MNFKSGSENSETTIKTVGNFGIERINFSASQILEIQNELFVLLKIAGLAFKFYPVVLC